MLDLLIVAYAQFVVV